MTHNKSLVKVEKKRPPLEGLIRARPHPNCLYTVELLYRREIFEEIHQHLIRAILLIMAGRPYPSSNNFSDIQVSGGDGVQIGNNYYGGILYIQI